MQAVARSADLKLSVNLVADCNDRNFRRIGAVHGDGEVERAAVLHDGGLCGADGVAAAALEGDGVGLLRPDGVEGGVLRDLFGHGRARSVDRSLARCILGPAEKVIACAGRDDRAQHDRLTVGLGGRRNGSRRNCRVAGRIQVIADRVRLRRIAAIEHQILIRRSPGILRRICIIRIPLSVPGIAGLRRCAQQRKRSAALHLLRRHLRAVEHVGHISEDDRLYVDGHGLVRGDIADRIFASRIAFLLPVDIDALDGVARARRDLESNVVVMLNSRALGLSRSRRGCEGHVDLVAHRQGDRVLDFLRQINVDLNVVFIRVILIIVFRILLLTLAPMLRGIGTNVVQSSPHIIRVRVFGFLSILDDKQILRIITIVESDGKGLLAAPRYVGLCSCFADPDAIVFITLRAVRLTPRAIISRIIDCHSVRFPDGIEGGIRVADRDFRAIRVVSISRCRIRFCRPAEEGIALGLRDEPRDGDRVALRAGQVVRPVRRAAVRRVVAHELHTVGRCRGGAVLCPQGAQRDIRVDAIDDPLTVRAFRHRRSKRSSGLGHFPTGKRVAVQCRRDRAGIECFAGAHRAGRNPLRVEVSRIKCNFEVFLKPRSQMNIPTDHRDCLPRIPVNILGGIAAMPTDKGISFLFRCCFSRNRIACAVVDRRIVRGICNCIQSSAVSIIYNFVLPPNAGDLDKDSCKRLQRLRRKI